MLPTEKWSRKKQGDIGFERGLNSVFLTIGLAIAGGVFIHNLESSGERNNCILSPLCLRSALEGIDSLKQSVVPTTTEKAIIRKEKHLEEDSTEDEEVIYKIEVAANRYDLLCLEGLAQALRIFVGIDPIPTYTLRSIRSESMLKMHVKPETSLIRPYVVCAVLRGITFDEERYNSFIDLQDRLHQNICRRRTLVAIGTHDLDTIDGPFTYEYGIYHDPRQRLEDPGPADRCSELKHRQLDIVRELNGEAVVEALMAVGGGVVIVEAMLVDLVVAFVVAAGVVAELVAVGVDLAALPPSDINFVPLKQVKNFRADELMEFYKVATLNGDIATVVSDVLEMKASLEGFPLRVLCLGCQVSSSGNRNKLFSMILHCYPIEGKSCSGYSFDSDLKLKKFLHIIENSSVYPVLCDCNRYFGFLVASLLNKMQLHAVKSLSEDKKCTFTVSVPPTRSDILHPCDVAEDVAIAYGYNEIPKRIPASLNPLPLNQFSDLIRSEVFAAFIYLLMPLLGDLPYNGYATGNLCCMDDSRSMVPKLYEAGAGERDDIEKLSKLSLLLGHQTFNAEISDLVSWDYFSDVVILSITLCFMKSYHLKLLCFQIAMCGFTEVLTWVLCSYKEDFAMLNRRDDKSTAVIIGNPRSSDFEVVRTSLMPGMLKTIGHNKDHPKPIKIFEVGDIVLLDETKDVGAANRRQLAALYCGATSGFEFAICSMVKLDAEDYECDHSISDSSPDAYTLQGKNLIRACSANLIHGLVDRVMEAIGCQFVQCGDNAGYYLERADEPEFLPGRQASIIYKGKRIGAFGIVHPEVLNNFDIPDACSFVELNIESFLQNQVSVFEAASPEVALLNEF
ncbi:hypothetical protein RHSIM_Rhsim01G0138800 [Rhododendron simsii]|uniref:phenylalanine--tRNA ligase n=1 Tax=Rhododendron simsii TaxID=118357 RepID=A0A834HV68_RHOSS|nr:hypothetical protein RHSIM_Rhsim01G0138800 [Rhododendron simsii]